MTLWRVTGDFSLKLQGPGLEGPRRWLGWDWDSESFYAYCQHPNKQTAYGPLETGPLIWRTGAQSSKGPSESHSGPEVS